MDELAYKLNVDPLQFAHHRSDKNEHSKSNKND